MMRDFYSNSENVVPMKVDGDYPPSYLQTGTRVNQMSSPGSPPTSPVSVLDIQEQYTKIFSSQRALFPVNVVQSSHSERVHEREKTPLLKTSGLSVASQEYSMLVAASKDDVLTLNRIIQSNTIDLNTQSDWWCDATTCNDGSKTRISSGFCYCKRTALMVAATNSSLGAIMTLIRHGASINCQSTDDGFTALHCAASSKENNKTKELLLSMLLQLNADRNIRDALGRVPLDLYKDSSSRIEQDRVNALQSETRCAQGTFSVFDTQQIENTNKSVSQVRSQSQSPATALDGSVHHNEPPQQQQQQQQQQIFQDPVQTLPQHYQLGLHGHGEHDEDEPASLSMLDVEEFCTDEFRMYQFKVLPCCRREPHNWRECPFVHEGETAKRRDPRIYKYSANACSEFRRGNCPHGDSCTLSHGVFESWLHPSRYRTKFCNDGVNCTRRVCFFAHTSDQLREVSDEEDEKICQPVPPPLAHALSGSNDMLHDNSLFGQHLGPAEQVSVRSLSDSLDNIDLEHLWRSDSQDSNEQLSRSSIWASTLDIGFSR